MDWTLLIMRVLFDNGVPRGLAQYLSGHIVEEGRSLGWERLSNGELIAEAEQAGFAVMVSADKNIRYQQNLRQRQIALIVLTNAQWPQVQRVAATIAEAIASVIAGGYIEVYVPPRF